MRTLTFAARWGSRGVLLAAAAYGAVAAIPETENDWIATVVVVVLFFLGYVVKVPDRRPASKPASQQQPAPGGQRPAKPAPATR